MGKGTTHEEPSDVLVVCVQGCLSDQISGSDIADTSHHWDRARESSTQLKCSERANGLTGSRIQVKSVIRQQPVEAWD